MPATYADFLSRKQQSPSEGGFEPLWLPPAAFPFQRLLAEWAIRLGRAALFADCGLGKALRFDEPVLTPLGWKPIGKLTVRDQVIGSDGKPHRVLGVYPQGVRELFAVRFTDGVEVVCDAEHLWAVKTQLQRYRGTAGRTLTTRQIIDEGLADGLGRKRHFVPLVRPVEMPELDIPIDPYTLGVLLGDGSFRSGSVSLTTADPEILSHLVLPPGVEVRPKAGCGGRTPCYMLSVGKAGCGAGRVNPLMERIRIMGLANRLSCEKFVPDVYLHSSIAHRRAILAGLLDTDGSVCDGTVEFVTTSALLAQNVAGLVQSLGGVAPIRTKQPYYTHKGVIRPGRLAYRLNVKLPSDCNPFRLQRKRDAWKPRTRVDPPRAIESVTPWGTDQAVCIRVDAPDSLFVTRGYVLTHNTLMQLVWAENVVRRTNRPVLMLTPLAVGGQTVREGAKFGIECERLAGRPAAYRPKVYVTNYERLHHFDPADFAAVDCDESSILKSYAGATRKQVTRFVAKLPYRLLATATASPNDYVELGTSSEALGGLTHTEMLRRFFKYLDDKGQKRELKKQAAAEAELAANPNYFKKLAFRVSQSIGQWRLRPHAVEHFWRWVASWARACRRPSDLGFSDDGFELPPLTERVHLIESDTPADRLFAAPAVGLHAEREERKRTLAERCGKVADLVNHDRPAVVWCHTNDEADRLVRDIPGSEQVAGRTPDERKVELYEAFAGGQLRVLVIKPKIGAWGLNWQHCNHVVTFASHSYEQHYQSVRRCWRFGQTRPVAVDVVATAGEERAVSSLQVKARKMDTLFSMLVGEMTRAERAERENPYTHPVRRPKWL